MASVRWPLLLVALLHSLATSSIHADGNLTHHSSPSLCLPDQASALLKLKQSFFFDAYSTTTLPSWQAGTDCCFWEGISCSNSSGHVTALDLSGIGLYSQGIDPVLFNLTSLRSLDLSINDFGGQRYGIPSVGFEKLAFLTHLNLSNIGIRGQVPTGISKLKNLISLDLGSYVFSVDDGGIIDGIPNDLREYYFHNLVANLTNLRELVLDRVRISSRAEDCFKALAKSTPHLWVLSLQQCGLQGHIDQSLKQLRSLVEIKLSSNYYMTPGSFPEFILNFLNLSVLQLADINLEGRFPQGIIQLKNLRVLDLSRNPNLFGQMPNFYDASFLEVLRLDMTNFSYTKLKSSSNFSSVMELSLDRNFITTDFISLSSIFVFVRKLVFTRINSPRTLDSVFSWLGNLKNLTSLVLRECDFSTAAASSIGNLKGLRSLIISNSNLTTQAISAVTNLKNLKSLVIVGSHLSGQLPSSIGNLTDLERLGIYNSDAFGPIPYEVGQMVKLKLFSLLYTGVSGRIPSSIW